MNKRDEVIKGLINMKQSCNRSYYDYTMCKTCPYESTNNCFYVILKDAIDQLKAQEPRVMTLEEVKAAKGSTVWLERSFAIGNKTVIVPIEITGIGTGGISFYFGEEDYRVYGRPVYGWRCWTSRPTYEQMEAVKWDDV